jgi:O-antigen/teichoic acid export membrane protein/acetyltransferase-like isoleucine patch superfamily enzyme
MSIRRFTIYNLTGTVVPMLVSLVTVPAYLHLIGNARYGILALVWLFLGYFGLFDPGITRAASYHIARLHSPAQDKERESVFWTALCVNLAFGVVGGIIVYLVARPLFMYTFKMPVYMRGEVMTSLPWLAASVTVSVAFGVLGGALEAREQFAYLNSITILTASLTQLAPLAVAYWHGPDLRWLIPTVLLARMLGVIPNFIGIARTLPLGTGGRFDPNQVKPLFKYGGWITLSNLLAPILTSMDRIVIGSVLNADSVAFYTVPFNLVVRTSVLPGALSTSLFPQLSRGNNEESAKLASDSVLALSAIMTPLFVLGTAALPFFMHVWVGSSFASQAVPVGIILILGAWFNGLAYIPYTHLQASGRPDLPAIFHAIELLPFLGVLWLGLHFFGLVGAATAWSLRVILDGILLFAVAGRIPGWWRALPGAAFLICAAICASSNLRSMNTGIELLIILASAVWAWRMSAKIRSSSPQLLAPLGEPGLALPWKDTEDPGSWDRSPKNVPMQLHLRLPVQEPAPVREAHADIAPALMALDNHHAIGGERLEDGRQHDEVAPRKNRRSPARFEDPFSHFSSVITGIYSWWIGTTYPFASLGKRLVIYFPLRLNRRQAHQVSLGKRVILGKETWLNIVGDEPGDPKIVIEDNCSLGARTIISAKNSVYIERDVIMATSVLIQDHLHAYEDVTIPICDQGLTSGGRIRIGQGCWIGQGAAIVCNDGELVVGQNSVVGANALVNRSFPANSVIIGNPGRLARQYAPAKGVWVGGEAGRIATSETSR